MRCSTRSTHRILTSGTVTVAFVLERAGIPYNALLLLSVTLICSPGPHKARTRPWHAIKANSETAALQPHKALNASSHAIYADLQSSLELEARRLKLDPKTFRSVGVGRAMPKRCYV